MGPSGSGRAPRHAPGGAAPGPEPDLSRRPCWPCISRMTPLAGMPIRLVQALNRHTGHRRQTGGPPALRPLRPRPGLRGEPRGGPGPGPPGRRHPPAQLPGPTTPRPSPPSISGPWPARESRCSASSTRSRGSWPRKMGLTPQELLDQDIPCLAIAQHTERLYPKAMVVPNFVPERRCRLPAKPRCAPVGRVFRTHHVRQRLGRPLEHQGRARK